MQVNANMLINGDYCTKCIKHCSYSLLEKEKNLMEIFKLTVYGNYFDEYAVIALKKYI